MHFVPSIWVPQTISPENKFSLTQPVNARSLYIRTCLSHPVVFWRWGTVHVIENHRQLFSPRLSMFIVEFPFIAANELIYHGPFGYNSSLKALDTSVKDQYSHLVCHITIMRTLTHSKFWLNYWSVKLQENNELEKKLVAQALADKWERLTAWSLPQIQVFLWEIPSFSRKIYVYFRGSRCSQCFILPTALMCSLPSKFVYSNWFWVITTIVPSAFNVPFCLRCLPEPCCKTLCMLRKINSLKDSVDLFCLQST